MKLIELNRLIDKTNLIAEFLEYMNAKEKFHVAKKLEIDGPISELLSVKRNNSDWEKIKIANGSIGWLPSSTLIRY